MKKLYLLALPALMLSQYANAQRLQFGVKAGLNSTRFRTKENQGPYRLLGANGGGFARYALRSTDRLQLAIQPELLYSGKGGLDREDVYLNDGNGRRLHCLDLPVLARANFRGLVLEAGPQLSTAVGRRSGIMSGYNLQHYAALQLGYAVGAGVELPAGLSFGLRYTNDLTPLNSGIGRGYNTARYYHTAWQAQVGYVFGQSATQPALWQPAFLANRAPHTPAANGLHVGLKAGVNSARYSSQGYGRPATLGANAGVFARYYLLANEAYSFAVQPEVLYSGKGGARVDYSARKRLHYLDVPVLARANYRGFVVEAGPQLSTLLGQGGGRAGEIDFNYYAPVQLGYAVGGGYELPSGLSLTVRRSADLTSFNRGVGFGTGYRNGVWQAQVGYLLAGR